MYLLIKYTKSLLWRVSKCLSSIQDARCLTFKPRERAFKQFKSPVLNVLSNETEIHSTVQFSQAAQFNSGCITFCHRILVCLSPCCWYPKLGFNRVLLSLWNDTCLFQLLKSEILREILDGIESTKRKETASSCPLDHLLGSFQSVTEDRWLACSRPNLLPHY